MDNRFIFLYHQLFVISNGGTRKGRAGVVKRLNW